MSGTSKSFTYDANGNLTSDGTRTFEWDAVDRLIAVVQGSNRSEFNYDGADHRVRIVEKVSGNVTSDRRFIWCGMEICEERDAGGGTVTRRFYGRGTEEGAAKYFYTRDHLGSIREMTDAAGVLRARYDYDPFGRASKVTGDKDALFTFTGHYSHGASGLLLTAYRAYDPVVSVKWWKSTDASSERVITRPPDLPSACPSIRRVL